ncbi:hypothetical protein EMIHUDRAFT_207215, partial [Emiliania huxleyi CCMP1516]|uniref:Major facilitator superfamily (MFS) profile domain-containing protein n=2 Tax=Emiliania huxleyi TaxID=2903 RepID=A0A0D3JF28_EMIH1
MSLRESLLAKPVKGDLCWTYIFYANVFIGCVQFSIVLPSLWIYLEGMGSTKAFYAAVVSAFSVGEAVGAILLGAVSSFAGVKPTLLFCCSLGAAGAAAYALAEAASNVSPGAGPWVALFGRLAQGIAAGGRQAVQQAYLARAAPPEQQTGLTAMMTTFACLGFIFGPAFGAAVGVIQPLAGTDAKFTRGRTRTQHDGFAIGVLTFDSLTLSGWFNSLADLFSLSLLACCFREIGPWGQHGATPSAAAESGAKGGGSQAQTTGVWACIIFFFIHFNGFAVQETITTPLVADWFGWDKTAANELFIASGVANLLCAAVMTALSTPREQPDGTMRQR